MEQELEQLETLYLFDRILFGCLSKKSRKSAMIMAWNEANELEDKRVASLVLDHAMRLEKGFKKILINKVDLVLSHRKEFHQSLGELYSQFTYL